MKKLRKIPIAENYRNPVNKLTDFWQFLMVEGQVKIFNQFAVWDVEVQDFSTSAAQTVTTV